VFHVGGAEIGLVQGWTLGELITTKGRWTVEGLRSEAKTLLDGRPPLASTGTTVEEISTAFVRRAGGAA
jgi:hypothetical protein